MISNILVIRDHFLNKWSSRNHVTQRDMYVHTNLLDFYVEFQLVDMNAKKFLVAVKKITFAWGQA